MTPSNIIPLTLRIKSALIASALTVLSTSASFAATSADNDSTAFFDIPVSKTVFNDSINADPNAYSIKIDGDSMILVTNKQKLSANERGFDVWVERDVTFTPSPTRAVWMSALFPGLGQVYNRRYWKLPIIVGGYLGLGYATSWNNTMLSDYQRAYRDIMDNDPSTKSYMDLFPPNTTEDSIDKTWLTTVLKNKKNYFRRNRDLCIISMVGVYLLAMVDAYVDASLSHFDISPDLSMDVVPSLIPDARDKLPGVGLTWAFNF